MKKKVLFFLARVIVSSSLIYLLIWKLGKERLKELPLYLKEASYPLLIIATLAFLIAVMLSAIRWKKLLEAQGISLKLSEVFHLTFIGFFFSNFLPSVIGGDAVKLYYLAKNTHQPISSLASIILDRIMGLFALVILAFSSLLVNLRLAQTRNMVLPVSGLFFFFLFLFIAFFFLKNTPLLEKFFKVRFLNVGGGIKRVLGIFKLYREKKSILGLSLFLSLIMHFLMIVICYLISLSFNIHIPFLYFLLFIPLIILITSLPVSIGGIGLREGSFVFFFTVVEGVNPMDAFMIGVGLYIVTLIASSYGGMIYLAKGGEFRGGKGE